jgi:hypothetical protein
VGVYGLKVRRKPCLIFRNNKNGINCNYGWLKGYTYDQYQYFPAIAVLRVPHGVRDLEAILDEDSTEDSEGNFS